jgi:phosphate starvation-inducible protein PhoH
MNLHRLIYFLATPFTLHALKNPLTTKYLVPLTSRANLSRGELSIARFSSDIPKRSDEILSSSRTFSSSKNDIPKQKNLAPKYVPKTANQQTYVKHLNNPDTSIVLGIGPAGCGKTLFACITALDQLKRGNIEKIVLTRPIVPVEDEEIGFLPGNLINKMDPWTRPIFDIILEHYQQHELTMMLKNNVIEVSPLAFMRGRTFKNAFIIADEMQNSTPNQMLMLTTRIGTNSKMVVTGDLKQSDRTGQKGQKGENGLRDLMYKLREPQNQNLTDIKMVEMQYEDVERSQIVKTILQLYSKENEKTGRQCTDIQSPTKKQPDNDSDAALIPKSQFK